MSHLTAHIGEAPARLDGVPCRSCGWMRYTVTLCATAGPKNVVLLVRCSRCGRIKDRLREIEALLRPSTAPRLG